MEERRCVKIAGRTSMKIRISAGCVKHIDLNTLLRTICGGAVSKKDLKARDVSFRSIKPSTTMMRMTLIKMTRKIK